MNMTTESLEQAKEEAKELAKKNGRMWWILEIKRRNSTVYALHDSRNNVPEGLKINFVAFPK